MPKYDVAAKMREQRSQTSGAQAKYMSEDSKNKKKKRHKEKLDRDIERVTWKAKTPDTVLPVETRRQVLKPVFIPPPAQEMVREMAVYTDVPIELEYPTLQIQKMSTAAIISSVSPIQQPGWEVMPVAFPFMGTVLGAIVIQSAKTVLASIAVSEVENWAGRQSYNVMGRNISVRVHTGRGAGRGNYMRLRGKGGEISDDDADPYDQPSEWWEFWKWLG